MVLLEVNCVPAHCPGQIQTFYLRIKAMHLKLATFATLLLTNLLTIAADWPQRRGPDNNGISAETNWSHSWPLEGPKLLWKASVGTGFSSIVAADGCAFTMGNTNDVDRVHCLDVKTGRSLWAFSYPEPANPKMYEGGPNSTPTFHGGRLFAASRTGKLFCLRSDTGIPVWSNDLAQVVGMNNGDWGLAGSPIVANARLYVNYGSAVVALDIDSGKAQWNSAKEEKGKFSFSTPVFSSDRSILFAHMHKSLFALSPGTGKELWHHRFGSGYETHAADPVITSKGVFVSSGDDGGELLAFTLQDETRLWKNKNLGTFTGSAVLLGTYLYGVDSGGYKIGGQQLRCVDLEKGEVKWSVPGFGQDSLIAAGDRLIVLTEKGELVIARAQPERAEVLARAQILGGKCWTQPALSDGRLFCRNAKGQVACLDLNLPSTR